MEKPIWRVRSSTLLVDSPYLRLRCDDIELPNGTVLPEYYVRESIGFVMIFAITLRREVVLVRQYRYGNDSISLELPAGSLDPGEDPLACAQRELREETGYTAARWEPLLRASAEPVRSTSAMTAFIAHDAERTDAQQLDPSEFIEVELAPLEEFRELLRAGGIDSVACIAAAYAALERIGSVSGDAIA